MFLKFTLGQYHLLRERSNSFLINPSIFINRYLKKCMLLLCYHFKWYKIYINSQLECSHLLTLIKYTNHVLPFFLVLFSDSIVRNRFCLYNPQTSMLSQNACPLNKVRSKDVTFETRDKACTFSLTLRDHYDFIFHSYISTYKVLANFVKGNKNNFL